MIKWKNIKFFDSKKYNKFMPEIAQRADLALITHAYDTSKFSILVSLVAATIMLIGLYGTANTAVLSFWYILYLTLVIARLALIKFYRSQKNPDANLALWRNLFVAGAILSGLAWGATPPLLFPVNNGLQQILCILIIAGIASGGAVTLSPVLKASMFFVILAIIPLIIFFKQYAYWLFDFALLLYIVFLIVLSVKFHHMFKDLIYLQVENDRLLKNLSLKNIELEQIATQDPLTKINNSRLFYVDFRNAIERAKRNKNLLALLYLDLDNFKTVNDSYGHSMGDQLLLIVVDKLKTILRTTDIISRVGGDEFTVILEQIVDRQSAIQIAQKICKTIALPTKINSIVLNITMSIGISFYPADGIDAETLVKVADNAMYHAKAHGRNNFYFNKNRSEK